MSDYLFIDGQAEAAALARHWAGLRRIAVDTEFVREDTFSARLCLLQLSDGHTAACVDVIALGGPGPFAPLLTNPQVQKVFHSARQDLEVLTAQLGEVPGPVWDTQIAAAMLGYADQVGYSRLAEAELGVTLPKDHARTDWGRRPLSEEQLRYAAADVHWLLPLATRLETALEQLERLSWAEAECVALCDPALYAFDAESAWSKVKGAGHLDDEALARVAALARWREEEARLRNRPRRWILKDEIIVALALENPATEGELDRLGLPPQLRRKQGEALLGLLRKASGADAPPRRPPVRLESTQERSARKLMGRLRELAEKHRISPPLLATRRDIEALVLGRRDLALLRGWRRELAGQELLALLEP